MEFRKGIGLIMATRVTEPQYRPLPPFVAFLELTSHGRQ